MTDPVWVSKYARTVAQAWIGRSADMITVLDWHKRLCGVCSTGKFCGEYQEIIDEYGAGTFGAAVFWPARE